jgi:hypothetical protein
MLEECETCSNMKEGTSELRREDCQVQSEARQGGRAVVGRIMHRKSRWHDSAIAKNLMCVTLVTYNIFINKLADGFFILQPMSRENKIFLCRHLVTNGEFDFLLATCACVYYLADLGGCNTKNHPIDLKKWWGSLMDWSKKEATPFFLLVNIWGTVSRFYLNINSWIRNLDSWPITIARVL